MGLQEDFDLRWSGMISKPFTPENPLIDRVPPEQRIAAAAEYMAAQLGQINEKLTILIEQTKPRDSS